MFLTVIFGALSGLALGLTGGGGSIIAVPLLLYGKHLPVHMAIQASLYAVFFTTFVGAIYHIYRKQVHFLAAGMMLLGGLLGSPVGAVLNHYLPSFVLIILFAFLMAIIGLRMWLKSFIKPAHIATVTNQAPSKWILLVAGIVTGILTGLLGVGGGFLIVPALLFAAKLKMPQAIATSLLVISMTALMSIIAHLQSSVSVHFSLVMLFAFGSLLGLGFGIWLSRFLSHQFLQRLFASFIVLIGIFMLVHQFIK